MSKDIFKQAAENNLRKVQNIEIMVEEENPSEELVVKTADFSQMEFEDIKKKEVKTFNDFKYAMENEHSVKFHRLLSALPPAQFMDKYLKALEFVKPKIIRSAGTGGKKKDGRVEVIINKNKKTG